MALRLVPTSQFKKDYKRAKKRGLDMSSSKQCSINSAQKSRSRSVIATMRSRGATSVSVNVTSVLIGYWYMQLTRAS